LVFWSSIAEQATFAMLYWDVFVLVSLLYFASMLMPDLFRFQNVPEAGSDVIIQIVAGLALGFMLVGDKIFATAFQSVLSPLGVPTIDVTGLLGWESMGQVFLMAVLVSELEQSMFSCSFRPSIARWIEDAKGFSVMFFLMGLLVWMMFFDWKVIGLAMMGISVVNFFTEGALSRSIKDPMISFGIGITFAAMFFALLHMRNFASLDAAAAQAILHNTFMFGVVSGVLDTFFDSGVVGKVAHTSNNAVLTCVAVGIFPAFGFVVAGLHGLLYYILASKVKA
jgi:hypothetical protein